MRILLTSLFMALFLISASFMECCFFETHLSASSNNDIAHHGGYGPHGDGCGH